MWCFGSWLFFLLGTFCSAQRVDNHEAVPCAGN